MEVSTTEALNILTSKFEGWTKGIIHALPNFFVALVVLIAFWYASKLVRITIRRALHRFAHNEPVARLMGSIGQSIVVITGIFVALGILELQKTVTSLLAGAGLAGLAIGFAFQEIAANFIAGVLIAIRKPFSQGDLVKVSGYEGRISSLDLRTTRIMSPDGLEYIVPNKDMFTQIVTNFTATDPRRVDVTVGVSYDDDLEEVKKIALAAVEDVSNRIADRAPEFYFTEFADSAVNFQIRVWIRKSDQFEFLTARSEMIQKIKTAFDEAEITIPFPIRALELRQQGAEGKFTPRLEEPDSDESDSRDSVTSPDSSSKPRAPKPDASSPNR